MKYFKFFSEYTRPYVFFAATNQPRLVINSLWLNLNVNPMSFQLKIPVVFIPLVLLLAMISTSNVFAQGKLAKIRFDKEVVNMDTIKEVDGPAAAVFTVYNDGDAVLRLLEVQASCGCTSKEYTLEPIEPGDSGFVKVIYDPVKRPGVFDKYVSVKCNDPERLETFLKIKGYVAPRPLRPDELFPHHLGSLLFKEGHRTFGTLSLGQKARDTFLLFNSSDQDIRLEKAAPRSKHTFFKTRLIPPSLGPGQEGMLEVTYDSRKRKDYGVLFDTVSFMTNDPEGHLKNLSVSVNIKEDFSSWNPKKRMKAARLSLNKDAYRFGLVKRGETLSTSFILKNDGQSDLIIRKVTSSCDCLQWDRFPERIPPGESREIKVMMATDELSGAQHKIITVITNDPENDQVFLRFIGSIN